MMQDEKNRKIARRLDEAKELSSKLGEKTVLTESDLSAATKDLVDAQQALESAGSPEGKKDAQKRYADARGVKDEKKQKDDIGQEKKRKSQGKVDEDMHLQEEENKKTKVLQELKQKTEERTEKAEADCESADHAGESQKEKYDQMQSKFKDWKLRQKAHNEQKAKKKEAMDVWSQLEKQTRAFNQQGFNSVDALMPKTGGQKLKSNMTPEQLKEHLANGGSIHDASGTELARQILGKDADGNELPGTSEKEEKLVARVHAQKAEPIDIVNHPLIKFAKERKQKCMNAEVPDDVSKERCKKADTAAEHFFRLKKGTESGDPLAQDTLHKWQARVGTDLKQYDTMVENLPLEDGSPNTEKSEDTSGGIPPTPEESAGGASPYERDDVVKPTPPELDPDEEEVLLQESGEPCADTKACQQRAKETQKQASDLAASTEKCDKNDAVMSTKLAGYEKAQAASQTKLEKLRATVKSLAPDVGEAADEAADAAIKASGLQLAAHKLAQETPAKHSEAKAAIEKAAEAHSKKVLAELRVTEATAFAELS